MRDQLGKAAERVQTNLKVRDDALSQAFEFAAGPIVMGLIGWLVDLAAGTGPLFLVIFAVVGVLGSFVSFYYRYQAESARLDEGKPWTRRTH